MLLELFVELRLENLFSYVVISLHFKYKLFRSYYITWLKYRVCTTVWLPYHFHIKIMATMATSINFSHRFMIKNV